jgi:hypothetical protein
MTADSARRSIGIRWVRATVPLPTGMVGDGGCQLNCKLAVPRIETQEVHDRTVKIFDIGGLLFFAAIGVGCLAFGVLGLGTIRGDALFGS